MTSLEDLKGKTQGLENALATAKTAATSAAAALQTANSAKLETAAALLASQAAVGDAVNDGDDVLDPLKQKEEEAENAVVKQNLVVTAAVEADLKAKQDVKDAQKALDDNKEAIKGAEKKAEEDAKAKAEKELRDKRKKELEEAKKKAEKEEREKELENRKKTAKALYVQVKDRMEKAGTLPKMQIKIEYKEKDEKKPIKEMAKEADMKMYETKDGTVIMYNGASVGGALKTSYAYSQAANCWVQIKSKEDTTKDEEMKLNNAKIDAYNDGLKTGMDRTEEAHKEACGIMLLSYHEALEKAEKELTDLSENYECIKIPASPTECELLEAEISKLNEQVAQKEAVLKLEISNLKIEIKEKEDEIKKVNETLKKEKAKPDPEPQIIIQTPKPQTPPPPPAPEIIIQTTYIAKPMLKVSHLKTCFVNVECASDLREGLVTVMLIPCNIIEKYFKLLRPPCRLENFITAIESDHETDGICISSHHYAHAQEEEEEEIKHHHHIEVIPGVLNNDLGIDEKHYDIGYKNDVGYQVLVLAKRDKTSYANIDTTVDGIQNYETHEFVCDKQFNCVAPPPPTITYSCSLEPCLEKGFHNYYDERINVIYKALIFSDAEISELKKIKSEDDMNEILSSHNPLLRAYNDLIQLGEPDYWSEDVDGGRMLFNDIYTKLNDLIQQMYSFWTLVGNVDKEGVFLQLKKEQFEELQALKYGDDKLWAHYRNLAAADYFSKNMMIIRKISGFDDSLVMWLDMWKTIKDNDPSMSGDKYNILVGLSTDFTSSVDEFIGMDTPQKFTDKAIKHLTENVHPKAKAWNDALVKENYTSDMIEIINKGTNDMAALPQPGDYDDVLIAPYINEVLKDTVLVPLSQNSKAKDSLEDKINKLTEENIKVEKELQQAIDDNEDIRLEEEYKAYTVQQALAGSPAKPKEEWEKERKKTLKITSVDADGNYKLNINAKMNQGSVTIITVPASVYSAEYDALIQDGALQDVFSKLTLGYKAHKVGIQLLPDGQRKGKVPTGIDATTAADWNAFMGTTAYGAVEYEYTAAERARMVVIVMYTDDDELYKPDLSNIVFDITAQPVVIDGLQEAAEGGEATEVTGGEAAEEEEPVVVENEAAPGPVVVEVENEPGPVARISTRNAEPLSALEECLQSLKELKEGLEKQEPETEKQEPETEEEKMLKELQELKRQLANVN